MRSSVLVDVVVVSVAFVAIARDARADREPVFSVDVAITSDENGPVVDRAWVDREMAVAEHVFGPLGVHLRVEYTRSIGSDLVHIEDPRMRDRFAALVTPHRIPVFIVRSLRDSEEVGVYRGGVTWDSRTTPSRRFVIVSTHSSLSTLAHELGHFFGIQPHSPVKNNLMSYDRDDALVFLDAGEQSLVKNRARVLQTSGALSVIDWL